MCFIKDINFNDLNRCNITSILDKDMFVIKVLIKKSVNKIFFKKYSYYSPYQDYKYIKGKLNTSPLGIMLIDRYNSEDYTLQIDEGFHSFRNKEEARNSYLSKDLEAVLCRCIIPKGSTIVMNNSEVVSNQIIFIEELKNNDKRRSC